MAQQVREEPDRGEAGLMTGAMAIGVDATCWNNQRGYGRYVRSLLRALVRIDAKTRYTFFMDAPETWEPLPPGIDVHQVPSLIPTMWRASARGHRALRDMWRMSLALATVESTCCCFQRFTAMFRC